MTKPEIECDICGGNLLDNPDLAMIFWDWEPGAPQVARLVVSHKGQCDPDNLGLSMELSWMAGRPWYELRRVVDGYPFNREQILKLIGVAAACSEFERPRRLVLKP